MFFWISSRHLLAKNLSLGGGITNIGRAMRAVTGFAIGIQRDRPPVKTEKLAINAKVEKREENCEGRAEAVRNREGADENREEVKRGHRSEGAREGVGNREGAQRGHPT